jgi:integrating conjugative element protein (TIGR03749 family)
MMPTTVRLTRLGLLAGLASACLMTALAVHAADSVATTTGTPDGTLGRLPGANVATEEADINPASGARPAPTRSQPESSLKTSSKRTTPTSSSMPVAERTAMTSTASTERLVFDRRPLRMALPVGRERIVSFGGPVAFHLPEDVEGVLRVQIIGATAYLTATAPFGTVRVVAEHLQGDGAQIPIDLVADKSTAQAGGDVEVFTAREAATRAQRALSATAAILVDREASSDEASEPVDLVMLTRYAAQAIYAPRRLAPAHPAVRQVPLVIEPVAGLVRGWRVETVPLASWRAGALYVTAVRATNQERLPVEIDLADLRGQWLAASSQHGRLGPAGADTDTTTLYLICDRPFEACR